jgi:hypothetical protein
MSLEVNSDRRWFLRTSAMALVASDLAMISMQKQKLIRQPRKLFRRSSEAPIRPSHH